MPVPQPRVKKTRMPAAPRSIQGTPVKVLSPHQFPGSKLTYRYTHSFGNIRQTYTPRGVSFSISSGRQRFTLSHGKQRFSTHIPAVGHSGGGRWRAR